MPRLKVGISLSTTSHIHNVHERARMVERLGFDSLWIPDSISGDGTPSLEAIVTLATAAAVTTRIQVGTGVLVPSLRSLPWLAAQLGTLQYLSGNRIILGIGSGGSDATPFTRAIGANIRARGRKTDAALDLLPQLLAGQPTQLTNEPDQPALTLAPAIPIPPILIGGSSETAMRRAATRGYGWFPSLLPPSTLAERATRLRALASEHGHQEAPSITVGGSFLPAEDKEAYNAFLHNMISSYGISAEQAATLPITGTPEQIAERLASYAEAGADRLVLALSARNWERQCERLAEALTILDR